MTILFGEDANKDVLQDSSESLLTSFKSGSSYIVRVLSPNDVAAVDMNGVYQCFNSAIAEQGDLYEKAQRVIYGYVNEAKKENDAEKEKKLKDVAKLLYPEKRFFRGFINLDTGKHMILDLTNKQNKIILEAIKENIEEIKDYAFKLSKTGTGQNTNVSLNIIVQKSKLTDTQMKNFEETANASFTKEMFINAIPTVTDKQRIENLRKFELKYKVSVLPKLGITPEEEHKPIDDCDEYEF